MTSRSTIDVPTPGGSMPAHLWVPDAGSGPGLLLVQEIFGISRYIESRAQDLADLGYVVLAPEIFWRLGVSRVEEGPSMLDEAMDLAGRADWDVAVADATAAFGTLRGRDEVRGDPGIIGFCYGGGLGFNVAATTDPAVLVSYYGSALPGLLGLADQVTAPALYHFGLADDYIEPAAVAEIAAAVVDPKRDDVRMETYDGAGHAFDNPDFPLHHPEASALAWERTVDFLDQHLTRA